jgi:hypothetical protein
MKQRDKVVSKDAPRKAAPRDERTDARSESKATNEVTPAEARLGMKGLDEKTEEIKAQADDLGMQDPGTEAKIQQMETAIPRTDRAENMQVVFDERNRVREAKAKELRDLRDKRRPVNEALSDKLQVNKDQDERFSEQARAREMATAPETKKAVNLNK